MDKSKFILPISILIGAAIIGGFFYAIQVNKQSSIERQQQLKSEEDKRLGEAKAQQDKQEFIAKKKNDCLSIYKTEDEKWNNVVGWRYNEDGDECYIEYTEKEPKTEEECDSEISALASNLRKYTLCMNGKFEKLF
jgi:hypothetical protein